MLIYLKHEKDNIRNHRDESQEPFRREVKVFSSFLQTL